jgi:hypothetical protein
MEIKSAAQWHAWFASRRDKLKWRLEQAKQAEWNWPSTRARCDIHRIEDEIAELDAEEFVVPSFAQDMKDAFDSCAIEGARL